METLWQNSFLFCFLFLITNINCQYEEAHERIILRAKLYFPLGRLFLGRRGVMVFHKNQVPCKTENISVENEEDIETRPYRFLIISRSGSLRNH